MIGVPTKETSPRAGGTGLWTTPVRGRAALSALAWVVGYVVGLVVLCLLGLLAASRLGAARPDAALLALAILGGSALAVLVAVRVHLLRRRGLTWADVGLRPPVHSLAHLLWQVPAVMVAGVVASMLVLVPLGTGPAGSDGLEDLATSGPPFVVLGLIAVAVLVPVAEEVVFRGIVLPALRARFRAVPGIALAGAVFAAVHLIPPALPYLLVVGISLCMMAQWYRSIVPGIVLHGVNNAVVFAGIVAAGTV